MKKKLMIVAHGLAGGGAERRAAIYANNFVGRGYSVVFVAAFADVEQYYLKPEVKRVFLHTKYHFGCTKYMDRCLQIYRIIRNHAPDVIISLVDNLLIISQMVGYPVIFALCNNPYFEGKPGVIHFLRNLSYRMAKHVVFQSEGAMKFFSRKVQSHGSVICNPMDTKLMPLRPVFTESKQFVALCRLDKLKNIPLMIDAFCEVHQKHSEFDLKIYGDGPEREFLLSLIHQRRAEGYIHLMGRTSEVFSVLENAFAFVQSSDSEGLSNSLLEAMCIGVPSISTDSPPGGARSVIQDHENGLLTPVGEIEPLVAAMNEFIENPKLVERCARKAVLLREKVSEERVCDAWEALF